jgi:hypothetical protein
MGTRVLYKAYAGRLPFADAAKESLRDRPPAALLEVDRVSLGRTEKAPRLPHRLRGPS